MAAVCACASLTLTCTHKQRNKHTACVLTHSHSTTTQGSKVFCLQYVNMATIDIPQGGSMSRYLERGDVQSAYQVACLGVTEADWRALAQAALQVCVRRGLWLLDGWLCRQHRNHNVICCQPPAEQYRDEPSSTLAV